MLGPGRVIMATSLTMGSRLWLEWHVRLFRLSLCTWLLTLLTLRCFSVLVPGRLEHLNSWNCGNILCLLCGNLIGPGSAVMMMVMIMVTVAVTISVV